MLRRVAILFCLATPALARSLGLCLATFLAPAAFGQQAQQAPEPPRNMAAVQCKLNESALNLAAGSWARTLDIAQDQEAENAQLKAAAEKAAATIAELQKQVEALIATTPGH